MGKGRKVDLTVQQYGICDRVFLMTQMERALIVYWDLQSRWRTETVQ